jgi:threonine/homoserine/homoserine lactone efflux protein
MLDYCYFAFLMLVGQLSPGPDMLLVLKNSFNHNLRAALFTIAGITGGILIHTTIALTGLTFLFKESGTLYSIFRYGGAIYLAYLGIQLLLSVSAKVTTSDEALSNSTPGRLSDSSAFLQGFITNLLNPKIIIIISSILLMFLDAESSLIQRVTYGTILVVEGVIVWILIALLLQTSTAKSQFLRWQSPINTLFGILLLALAIRAVL